MSKDRDGRDDLVEYFFDWYSTILLMGIAGFVLFKLLNAIGGPSRWVERRKGTIWRENELQRYRDVYRSMHGEDPPVGSEPGRLFIDLEYMQSAKVIEERWRATNRVFERLRSEGQYVNGIKFGEWIYWHDNGRVAWRGRYGNGRLEGRCTSWREDGKVESVRNYSQGKLLEDPRGSDRQCNT